MQIERFLSIIQDLNQELNQEELFTIVNEIIELIPQVSKQEDVDGLLDRLREISSKSKINTFPPSKMKILNSIGGTKFFGNKASLNIESIVRSASIYNPTDKASKLTTYLSEVREFKSKIAATEGDLINLGLTAHRLSENKFEVGIILSESITAGYEIKQIQKYLEEWHLLLRYLNEITSHDHSNPKISALGSNDSLDIYFENSKETAECISIAIDKISCIYLKVIEGKNDLEKIKEKGFLSKGIEKDFEDTKKKMIDDGINEIVSDIIAKHGDKSDEGRLNELKNGLKKSFEFIAICIDSGIDVEVNTPDPVKPEDINENDSEDIKDQKNQALTKYQKEKDEYNRISSLGGKTKELPESRSVRILGLPEPNLSEELSIASIEEKKTTKKKNVSEAVQEQDE